MVVLVGMRNAEVQAHLVQKIRLGQLHTPGLEVTRHIKAQPVGTSAQAGVVEQRRIGAAVMVQHQALDEGGVVANLADDINDVDVMVDGRIGVDLIDNGNVEDDFYN